jgi:tetratricopeptide (TPR) repeat protein
MLAHKREIFQDLRRWINYPRRERQEKILEARLDEIADQEKHYGKDHPQTGITLTNLGNAWGSLGDYEKQKDLLTRVLEISEKHYGKDHPQTGITLDNLGDAWGSLGDYEKQKDLSTRALEIKEKHYGKDHPQTGIFFSLNKNTLL